MSGREHEGGFWDAGYVLNLVSGYTSVSSL